MATPVHTLVPMPAESSADYPPDSSYPPSAPPRVTSHPAGRGKDGASWVRSRLVRLTVDLDDASTQGRPKETEPSGSNQPASPSAPKWFTLEFYFYALAFAIVFPYMWYVPIKMSQPSDPHYGKYQHYLAPGWIGTRKRDNSDFQYRTFRDSIPVLFSLITCYLVLSFLVEWGFRKLSAGQRRGRYAPLAPGSHSDNDTRLSSSSPSRRPGRRAFLALFSAVYLFISHGTNVTKLLMCCSVNYVLAKRLAGLQFVAPAVIWTFNIAALYLVHYFNGIPLAQYGSFFALLVSIDLSVRRRVGWIAWKADLLGRLLLTGLGRKSTRGF